MAGSIPESPAACNKLFQISSVDSSLRNWGTATLGSKNNGSSGPRFTAELFSKQFLLLNDDLRGLLIDWNRVLILVDLALPETYSPC
jgi:hypothetical protein